MLLDKIKPVPPVRVWNGIDNLKVRRLTRKEQHVFGTGDGAGLRIITTIKNIFFEPDFCTKLNPDRIPVMIRTIIRFVSCLTIQFRNYGQFKSSNS